MSFDSEDIKLEVTKVKGLNTLWLNIYPDKQALSALIKETFQLGFDSLKNFEKWSMHADLKPYDQVLEPWDYRSYERWEPPNEENEAEEERMDEPLPGEDQNGTEEELDESEPGEEEGHNLAIGGEEPGYDADIENQQQDSETNDDHQFPPMYQPRQPIRGDIIQFWDQTIDAGIELAILARGPWNEFSNLVCFSFPIILINTPVFQFFPPQKRD